MTVGRICTREVDLVDTFEKVTTAAQRMLQRNVGTLVVVDGGKKPVGILTDRDLTIRVVAKGLDPATVVVQDVMTPEPKLVREDIPIETAVSMMRTGGVRRLPVVDRLGSLEGIVSVDAVIGVIAEETGQMAKLLERENPRSLGETLESTS